MSATMDVQNLFNVKVGSPSKLLSSSSFGFNMTSCRAKLSWSLAEQKASDE